MDHIDLSTVDLEAMEMQLGIQPWRIQLAAGQPVPVDEALMAKIRQAERLEQLIKLRAETLPGSQEEGLCWLQLLQACTTVEQVDAQAHVLATRSPLLQHLLSRREILLERDLTLAGTLDEVLAVYAKAGRRTCLESKALMKLTTFFQKA